MRLSLERFKRNFIYNYLPSMNKTSGEKHNKDGKVHYSVASTPIQKILPVP